MGSVDDVSLLWDALRQAKQEGDVDLVRALEQRMREVGSELRFAHLSDDELRDQIAALKGARGPEGMLAHSPGGGGHGGGFDSAHTSQFNEAIRANQHVGLEVKLAAMEEEWSRRQPQAD